MKCNWKECTLGDLITFQRGHDLPKSQMINGKYPVVGSNGIIGYHNEYTTEAPSITIGRSGNVGNPYIVNGRTWSHNTTLYVKDFKGNDPVFVYYFLKTMDLANYAGGSAVPTLNRNHIHTLPIEVPESVGVQKKIGYYLRLFDEKIELNNEINNNLEQQMQALYKSWFIGFKPFGNTMPCNWKTGKLKEVLKLKRQSLKAGDNTELPYLPIDVIPMRTFALTGFKPNSEAQSSLITFDKDDIIIGAMRVYFHRVVLAPCDGITRTTCFTLAPYNNEYLSFALLCCDQESSIDYAQSTSKGSTMPYAIWEGGLGDMEIIIPTPEIAKKFNEIVLPMLRQIQNSYFENNRLREIRDALLPRLMSGELDVSDIDL